MKRVILVHGIREFGRWFTAVENMMRNKGVAVDRVGFDYLNALGFLLPFGARRRAEAKVSKLIQEVFSNNPGDDIAIIAFSFGTHATIKALSEHKELRPLLIIFSGAVASVDDFDWSEIARRTKRDLLLNEVGTNDPWPVVAEAFGVGFGQAGSRGANVPDVRNRFHDATHTPTYKKKNGQLVYAEWADIIADDAEPANSDDQHPSPSWFGAIQPFIRGGLPALALAAIALGFFPHGVARAFQSPIPPWVQPRIEQLTSHLDLSESACTAEGRRRVETRTDTYTFSNYVRALHNYVRYEDTSVEPTLYVGGKRERAVREERRTTDVEEYAGAWSASVTAPGHDATIRWQRAENVSVLPPGDLELFPGNLPAEAVDVRIDQPRGTNITILYKPWIIDRSGRVATVGGQQQVQCSPVGLNGVRCDFRDLPNEVLPAEYGISIDYQITPWQCPPE